MKASGIACRPGAGPCPKCGERDRFAVNVKQRLWSCRRCATDGSDALSLVMHVCGLNLRDGVAFLVRGDATPAPARLRPGGGARRRRRSPDGARMRCSRRAKPTGSHTPANANPPLVVLGLPGGPERPEKMFGLDPPRALDRNAEVRIMHWGRCLSRRTEKGRAYGIVTAKALAVLEALL
jgi:hypothetical protein